MEWIDIKEFEGHYQINKLGQIRSIKKGRDSKMLKPILQITGYYNVGLRKEGSLKQYRLHKLVAMHFIPNDGNKRTINHKDGDKSNNKVSNLEWATDSENIKHAFNIGLRSHKGEKSTSAKLTNGQANEIRELYKTNNYKQSELAVKFGITQRNISQIILNRSYTN